MDHNQASDAFAKLSFNLGLFAGDLTRDRNNPTVSRQHVVTVLRHLAWGGDYKRPGTDSVPARTPRDHSKINYTSHGHAYPSSIQGTQPQLVAKCGGPALCLECGTEAGWGRQQDGYIEPIQLQLDAMRRTGDQAGP